MESARKTRVKNTDPFLTVSEAAEYCGVGVDLIYERIRDGSIEAYRLSGRAMRIRLSALTQWYESTKTIIFRRPRSRAVI